MPTITRKTAMDLVKTLQRTGSPYAVRCRDNFRASGVIDNDDIVLLKAHAGGPSKTAISFDEMFPNTEENTMTDPSIMNKIGEILINEHVSPAACQQIMALLGGGSDRDDLDTPRTPAEMRAAMDAAPGGKSFADMFPGADRIQTGAVITPAGR